MDISQSDWIIDMGADAGKKGGRVVFEGHPNDTMIYENSITGKYLR